MKASKIRLLSPELVHRIAAGEVVENAASAMKELVENSIDAGATKVSVLVAEGGLNLIEVKDNGLGMSREDLEACCQRHATSKIKDIEDLDHIFSLGFRGEALAALSSVSNLEISSCEQGASEAWLLKRQGASFETLPTSRKQGTTVRVCDLFFNTPARKKFLKSAASESSKCIKIFKELCVSHPEVELSLHILGASGEVEEEMHFLSQNRKERLSSLLGKESELFFTSSSFSKVPGLKKIEILFLRPPHFSRNSKDIYFIVNGRPVEDKRIPYVLREAFGGLIEVGAYPRGAVFLEVDPTDVDVNVHPQKKEIRWSKDFPLHSLVYNEVKGALEEMHKGNKLIVDSSKNSSLEAQKDLLADFYSVSFSAAESPHSISSTLVTTQAVKDSLASQAEPVSSINFASLRVIGELGAAWLLCESPEGLIVIDQHAAHERVNFDRLINQETLVEAAPLLVPLELQLPLQLKNREEELLQVLESWSFEGRVISDRKLELFAIPKSQRKLDWKNLFDEIFDRFDQNVSTEALQKTLKTWIASSVACHGSVRRGQRLSNDEIAELLKQLDQVDWKEFCPHGRPTWILFSHLQLEEEFHRS